MGGRKSIIKNTASDYVFDITNITILVLFTLTILLSLLSVVSVSFISKAELSSQDLIIFPRHPSLDAYKIILMGSNDIPKGYLITVLRTIIGTFLNMLFSCFLAFLLTKRDLPFRKGITLFLFFTMLFGGGLIPTYLVVKSTGLLGSFWVYIIPGLISVWNVLLLRNFMMEIPQSLTDAAEIDGCSQLRLLFQIILPLSTAAIVTISLFYAVGHWNSWWDAYLYISNRNLFPLQLILRNILATALIKISDLSGVNLAELMQTLRPPSRSIQNAAVIITMLPIVCVYPFLQKYFIKGIMIGSIKG